MRFALLASVLLFACGDDGGTTKTDAPVAPKDSPSTSDAPKTVDAPPGATTFVLKNYLAWCDVGINGMASSTAAVQTVTVDPGDVNLIAKAAQGFIIGGNMWHHTTGDTGNGETGTVSGSGATKQSLATATVANGETKCVWVCCPIPDGSGCDVADQCP